VTQVSKSRRNRTVFSQICYSTGPQLADFTLNFNLRDGILVAVNQDRIEKFFGGRK